MSGLDLHDLPATNDGSPTWWDRLIEPHPSEHDLHYGRVLRPVAAWHLLTIPLGPLLALLQVIAGEGDRIRALWLIIAPCSTLLNYVLSRSRWGRVGLAYQVISIFCIVVASIYVSPDRIAPLCALILPVLAAALCFNFASVMLVQLAALSVIAVRVLEAPHAERGLFIGFGIVMIAAFAIVGAIVRHREVLHQGLLLQPRRLPIRC